MVCIKFQIAYDLAVKIGDSCDCQVIDYINIDLKFNLNLDKPKD